MFVLILGPRREIINCSEANPGFKRNYSSYHLFFKRGMMKLDLECWPSLDINSTLSMLANLIRGSLSTNCNGLSC